MKKLIMAAVAATFFLPALAQTQATDSLPARVIILTGDPMHPDHAGNVEVMYTDPNSAFQDPQAPRFLFLDKKGEIALGIGGYMKAMGQYDFDGAIDNSGFVTSDIPVPFKSSQDSRLGGNFNHSTIFLKLVTRPTKLGRVVVYLQSNFGGAGNTFELSQAYVRLGHVTIGKARSTFVDGPAQAPTVDNEGPSGQVTGKNLLLQYMSPSYSGFSYAVSAEIPRATYTTSAGTQTMDQRFPDIPAYLQYQWAGGDSHIRLSGILRRLSYRDVNDNDNRFGTGWGAQISTITSLYPSTLSFFGHYTYGKGIETYVNDLGGMGYDLVPDGNGKLKAPAVGAWTAGFQYNFTSNLFATVSYSQARLYDVSALGSDTYKYGQYVAANVFYNFDANLQFGLEYLHGNRTNYSGETGRANRIEAMVQYSF